MSRPLVNEPLWAFPILPDIADVVSDLLALQFESLLVANARSKQNLCKYAEDQHHTAEMTQLHCVGYVGSVSERA
jgi:hypothetical protein